MSEGVPVSPLRPLGGWPAVADGRLRGVLAHSREFRSASSPVRGADRAFRCITAALAAAVVLLLVLILWQLVTGSRPAISAFGFSFLVSREWDPVREVFGALPFLYGTIVSSLVALAIALPFSLGVAVFLAELAPWWLRGPAGLLVELLAAIPSVVYGLWGIFVLVPWLREVVEPFLGRYLGFLPLFQGPPLGVGLLAGGFILAIMIIPIISAIVREVLLAVPRSQREGMLALGATRWETVRMVVLPYGRAGIVGGVLLGLGRALGETMAVTMVIGNRPEITASLFQPAYSAAAVIANEFTEATSDLHLAALIEVGLVLFLVTIVVNILARLLVWRAVRATGGVVRE